MKTCPVCSSTAATETLCKVNLVYQADFDLVECPDCKVKYFNPLPTTEQLSQFYSALPYEFDRWRQEAKADYYISKLLKQRKAGSILDIGCASGYFLHRISAKTDWDTQGVELGELPASFARETLGLDVYTGDLFSAAYPDNSFDAIHIGDVLEHVPNPRDFLEESRRILKHDGRLYLAVPNGYVDSRGLIQFYKEEHKPGRHASGHIFFFERDTLLQLFKLTGFETSFEYTILIKNGLRALGYLPKRHKWKNFYTPSNKPETPCESTIPSVTKKPHSDFYYKYHFYKKLVFGLSGLRSFGNDYMIELKPAKH